MKNLVLAGLGSLILVGSAGAGFTNYVAVTSVNGANTTLDLYAGFDNGAAVGGDVLLNIFNSAVSVSGGFGTLIHSDFVGGSWAPQFSTNPALDSFVLIGGAANFANSTQADPNWGAPGFNQLGIPALAGWANTNPPNLQGKALALGASFGTHIGRFVRVAKKILHTIFVDGNGNVVGEEFSDTFDSLSFDGSFTFNQGLGTPGQQGTAGGDFDFAAILNEQIVVIPAPGALALLGLAGLAGGRRRRA